MIDLDTLLERFAAALNRLASSSQEQAKYLTELGVADMLDELGLEFDDFYLPLAWQLAEVRNGAELKAACEAVDSALSSSSLGWTFGDLDSPAWENIRRLADRAQSLVESSLRAE